MVMGGEGPEVMTVRPPLLYLDDPQKLLSHFTKGRNDLLPYCIISVQYPSVYPSVSSFWPLFPSCLASLP